MDMKGIGKRIKELRSEIDITQNKLADILGVTQDSISLWETEKRIPDTQYVITLAKFFDVTTDYLLGLTDDFTSLKFGHEGREKYWLSTAEQRLIESYRKLSPQDKGEWIRSMDK